MVDEEIEWTVVKSKGEHKPPATFHECLKYPSSTLGEGEELRCTNPSEGPETYERNAEILDHHTLSPDEITSLVGAPIKLVSKQILNPVGTPGSLRDKIGEGFYLRAHGDVIVKTRQSIADLDLCDAGEWPSMGKVATLQSQLPSWSNAVKNPPPPQVVGQGVKEEELLDVKEHSSDGEDMVVGKKKKKKKKTSERRAPLMLEFADIFQNLEEKKVSDKKTKKVVVATGGGVALFRKPPPPKLAPGSHEAKLHIGNTLDSSAPALRRGKERETPKKKRPSALRKVIAKEKADRKQDLEGAAMVEETGQSELEEIPVEVSQQAAPESEQVSRQVIPTATPTSDQDSRRVIPAVPASEQVSHRVTLTTATPTSEQVSHQVTLTPASEQVSHQVTLTATTPASEQVSHRVTLTAATPTSEQVSHRVTLTAATPTSEQVSHRVTLTAATPTEQVSHRVITTATTHKSVHNRKFREYCSHVITEEINECVEKLLTDLRNFQDRQHLRDPTKSKAKRRYVCGLREVLKHLKLKKLKCVIVPPNLDRIQSEGGIDDLVAQIVELCKELEVPAVFAMTRRRLAVLLRKKHRIGCVGIFYYDGAEAHYKKLMEFVSSAEVDYQDKVSHLKHTQHCSGTSKNHGRCSEADHGQCSGMDHGQSSGIGHDQYNGTDHSHYSGMDNGYRGCQGQLYSGMNLDGMQYVGCESSTYLALEEAAQLKTTALEFIPTGSLNINAAVFTPSFMTRE